MGKRTTGKKNKDDETDADTLEEEVINSRIRHEVSDNNVEFRATPNDVVAEDDVDVKRQKKNKKKKRDEIRDDDVELCAVSKNEVALRDWKKRKNKQRNEDGVNDAGLREGRIEDLVESNADEAESEKKEKKKKKKLLEDGSDGAESSVNQSKAVIDIDVHVHKEKKKKKKSKKRQEVSCDDDEFGSTINETVVEGDVDMNTENKKDRKKKKKKKKKRKLEIKEDETVLEGDVDMNTENEKDGKKKKKRKLGINEAKKNKDERFNNEDEVSGVLNQGLKHHLELDENTSLHKQKNGLEEEGENNKKKKAMSMGKHSGGDKKVSRTKKGVKPNDPSESSAHKERPKKVSFSDHVQVVPSSEAKSDKNDGFVRGKRFSLEEDEMIKKAVINYIEAHRLGEDGLNMVLHCRSYPEIKHCWKEIGAALPWRPCESIYYRAHILFERDENHKWTPEELELVRKFYEKHGSDWKTMADTLGKHRFHVKDAWRRIKLPNQKKGQWSQEEYQKLFDLVNMDLRMKASEEKRTKHGMLRDNISWEAISEKLSTRTNAICCMKWYDQLTSPMVAKGKWADTDDFHLVNALSGLDACCMDDVDWDNLLEHRSGTICRKRWNQIVKHLGTDGNKSFPEQVEILSTRYCPDVLEARLAYNSKGTTV
ncbi:hypothetical protein CUMW_008240 [Citrus unshiu]|nr:hypothetical protein CUMW_008240 [Citrus unshiu]